MKRNYSYTLEEQVEILYNRMFTRKYSGNDKIFDDSTIHQSKGYKSDIALIKALLIAGADVRTGSTKTKIRGVRNRYIFETGFAD